MSHLSDFIQNGREFTISLLDDKAQPVEFKIFIRRPTSLQQESAMTKANAKQAQRRASYRDKPDEPSEARLVLREMFEALEDEEIVEHIVRQESARAIQQASNEVLHSDEIGSKWDGVDEETGEGWDYVAIVGAISDRYSELQEISKEFETPVDYENDEKLKDLLDIQKIFDDEVEKRRAELVKQLSAPYKKSSREDLIEKAVRVSIESDCQIAWYETWRMWMLFYAIRYADDHKKLYFKDIDDLFDLDESVRMALHLYYDEVDKGLDNTKGLLTPVDSSPSSE